MKKERKATDAKENTRRKLTEKELEKVVGGRKGAPGGCILGRN